MTEDTSRAFPLLVTSPEQDAEFLRNSVKVTEIRWFSRYTDSLQPPTKTATVLAFKSDDSAGLDRREADET